MLVSIIILTQNKNPLTALKNDLDNQTYQDFEIIYATEKGIVAAMNSALERARGDIFVRIDDDVALPPKWLEQLIQPFTDDPLVAGVTGPTFVLHKFRGNRDSIRWAEHPKGLLRWLYDNNEFNPAGIRKCGCVSYDSNYEERFGKVEYYVDEYHRIKNIFSPRLVTSNPDHLEGTNWAMRTDLIRQVGGFDPKFDGVAEWFDTDVEFKIKKLGYKLRYNPKAYLYHLLEKGESYNDRFSGWGRIKNWLRFHIRHSKFHPKMIVFLIVWIGYFVWKSFENTKKSR